MALPLLDEDSREAERCGLEIEFDLAEVEGVEAQFERAAGPARIDLVAIALQRERGVALDLAFLTPEEGTAQRFGVDGDVPGRGRRCNARAASAAFRCGRAGGRGIRARPTAIR